MTRDTTAGIFAVLAGSAYLVASFEIPLFEAGDEIGPRVFPFMIAAVVICCGVALLVKEFRNMDRQPFSWGFGSESGIWRSIILTIAAGIIYGLVLDWLGYVVATFLFMLAVGSIINRRRHVQNTVIAASFSLVTFVAFALLLKLSLPRGILGEVLPF